MGDAIRPGRGAVRASFLDGAFFVVVQIPRFARDDMSPQSPKLIPKSVALIPDSVAGATQLHVSTSQLVADERESPVRVPQQQPRIPQ